MSTMMCLVRHGQTEWSRDGRHTGLTDLPLTTDGQAVARSLAPLLRSLAPDRVWTSPLRRARQTAELAGFANAASLDDLTEWNYGDYEGLTTAQIRESVPDWTVWSQPVPGGETAAEVATRADRVIRKARELGGTTLVFGHGHALRVLAARWLDEPPAIGRHLLLDTATYSILGDDRAEPVIRRWNVEAK